MDVGFNWGFPGLGFVVGLIVGMTGMGGGAIMTAALIGVFGVPAMVAVGTDLLFAGVSKIVGTSAHARNNNVDWSLAGLLAAGSVPTSIAVLYGLSHVGVNNPTLAIWVSRLIGCAILLAAVTMVFQGRLRAVRTSSARTAAASAPLSPTLAAKTVLLGAVLGALVTVSSVGAGAIGLAVLFLLYPRMTAARVVGSDIAHATPLTIIAGLGHAFIGTIDWTLLGLLLAGSLPGIFLGSQLAHVIPERILFVILALVLLVIGARLLVGTFH